MEFTPWSLLVDAGLIGLLLAAGTLLRAVIKPLQNLMIPASVIAGFLGLALGPAGLSWLPFSDQLETYTSVLIVLVFACLAMTGEFNFLKIGRSIGSFASYSVLMYSSQVVVGMLLALLIFVPLFNTSESFGVLLFAGWAGGFGSAAAVGQVFGDAGEPELQSLAFTSATVGILISIIGGIILAKIGAKRGHVIEFSGMSKIPRDMRTGVLDQSQNRPAVGTHTFSASSVESLAFQLGIILAISAGAYGVSEFLGGLVPEATFPVFSIAFAVGLVVRYLFKLAKTSRFVDGNSMRSISGASTDVLIVCGIASIMPTLVVDYVVPLIIMFIVGLVLVLSMGVFVSPRVLLDARFEKQLFTWGWTTGAVAAGIALLRIVDPKLKSRTLEDFALAYIAVAPVEIIAVTFVPTLILAGAAWAVVGIWGAITIVALVMAIVFAKARAPASADSS